MERLKVSFRLFCLAVLVPLGSSPAVARELRSLDSEFQVNTYTPSYQQSPSVGMDGEGGFVVVWRSQYQDGSNAGIFAQRLDSAGTPRGTEFQVNSSTVDVDFEPDVAVSEGGSFVVTWWAEQMSGTDIRMRRFDAAGAAVGLEIQVDSYDASQSSPALAIDPEDGDFVVVWSSYGRDGDRRGVFARRFDSSGAGQGVEFQVNTRTQYDQEDPDVAARQDGGFIVVWESQQQDGFNGGIFAQRFASSGLRVGEEFQVNSYTVSGQNEPSIAIDAVGAFVVVWDSGGDGSYYGAFGRRFDSTGSAQAAEFQVNVYTPGTQVQPRVSMSRGGEFVVAWTSHMDHDGASGGIFARHFDAAGAALATEFQVNTHTLQQQALPVVAANGGEVVVAWSSRDQDGSDAGIFAQRYRSPSIFDLDGNGSTDPLTDGLLLLRFLFGFTGATLISGVVDLDDCLRCNAAAIEAFLATVSGQELVATGTEFQVNSFTPYSQGLPAVGINAGGAFVVAWNSNGQDGAESGVFGQRFGADGVPSGVEFLVNSLTEERQLDPRIGVTGGGSFVVVWTSVVDDEPRDVFARLFSAGGVAAGPEFQVELSAGVQDGPSVAVEGDGDFVVAWVSVDQDGGGEGVFARRFDSSGAGLGGEFQVNTRTNGDQNLPAVAVRGGSGFVVTWSSQLQDGDQSGVFARRFDASGVALGVEFQVNSYTESYQDTSAVAMGSDGFVIAWNSNGQDGNYNGVFAQRFDSVGVRKGAEFQVNVRTVNTQASPELGVDDRGDFVVTWLGSQQDGSFDGVFSRRFDAAGVALATEFQVNTYTLANERDPAVAVNADGDVVVTWQSDGDHDGSDVGVFAQRYRTLGVFDVDGNGSSDPLTDGLLVVRFLFGFTGETLVSGVVDLGGCTRCDAAAIEAYLEPRV